MLDRIVRGEVPEKHHIKFEGPDGALLHEECITRRGFDGPYTIAYHQHRPQAAVHGPDKHGFAAPEAAPKRKLAKRHFKSQDLSPRLGPAIDGRIPMLFNDDVVVSVLHPSEPDPVYFSNGDGDDLYFIFEGSGVLRSVLGDVRFEKNDYLCVPKGITHRFIPDEGVAQYWVVMECLGGVKLLDQWRNPAGQLRMDAPYCHRDFRRPEFKGPLDEGIRDVVIKQGHEFTTFHYEHSPLDVHGWDGAVYPWVFPILKFQARAGLVHLPPDWHGTFATRDALICSFVPRVVDFHDDAIPCPYPHSSVDCDEILFYVSGNFTSRKGVGPGSISYHPMGMPHGPHPGAYEASIGVKRTDELALMIDTFKPLKVAAKALSIEDPDYMASFL